MKKQIIIRLLAAVVTGSIVFIGCFKNDNANPVPAPIQRLLYDWKIINITYHKQLTLQRTAAFLKLV